MKQVNEEFVDKVKELKERLPYGSQQLISERTGISHRSVSRFFNGNRLHIRTSKIILIEGFKILKEQKELLNTEV